jgi:hypothetical protein
MKYLILSILIITLSSCAFLDIVTTKTTEKISEAVVKYCEKSSEQFRTVFRNEINEQLDGKATVKIDCIE